MGRDEQRRLAGEEGKGLPRLWCVFGGSSAVVCGGPRCFRGEGRGGELMVGTGVAK